MAQLLQDYMPVPEAARELSLNAEYVRQRIRQGKIPAVRFGREYAIPREWIKRYKSARRGLNKHNPTPAVV